MEKNKVDGDGVVTGCGSIDKAPTKTIPYFNLQDKKNHLQINNF